MNLSLKTSLAAIAAVLLLLPPGWCGWAFAAGDAPVQASCCHKGPRQAPADSAPAPCHTGDDCCCDRDLIPPQPSNAPDDEAPALAHAPLVSPPTAATLACLDRLSADLHDDAPRVHVLQCVWLC